MCVVKTGKSCAANIIKNWMFFFSEVTQSVLKFYIQYLDELDVKATQYVIDFLGFMTFINDNEEITFDF